MKKHLIMMFMLVVPALARATPLTLDFETLPAGTAVTDQYLEFGVLISSSFGEVTVFTGCCSSSGSHSLDGGHFREVTVTFVAPGDPLRAAVTDFFSVTLGDIDIPGSGFTAYDIQGNEIAQVGVSCAAAFACPGEDLYETLTLSRAGIHRVVIAAGGQLGGAQAQPEATVDDIAFNAVVAQVPEASSAHMLAGGITVLGWAVLRRRRALSRGTSASR